MGYKRYSYWTILAVVFSKKARDAMAKSKAVGVTGNMKGDGLGTGGALIVSKEGKGVLLDFKQSAPGDHVSLVDVLKALGIDEQPPESLKKETDKPATCGETSRRTEETKTAEGEKA